MQPVKWLKTEWKALFEWQQTQKLWHIALLAALCMAVPMLLGLYLGQLKSALLAAIGGLVIFYLPDAPVKQRMLTLLICSALFVVSYGIGLSFSFQFVPKILALTMFTLVVQAGCLYYNLAPPGSTFFILLVSIAAYTPYNAGSIAPRLEILAAGTSVACTIALLYSFITAQSHPPVAVVAGAQLSKSEIVFEAAIIALFVGLSLLAAQLLKLERPYWVPVSCVAVMRAVDVQQVWRRSFQRVLGTMAGLGLARVLLLAKINTLTICLSVPALQFLAQYFVPRNYALGLVFITPMALLLAEATTANFNPDALIITRFADIALGSAIGAIGGYLLYHQQLRTQTTQQLRKWGKPLSERIWSLRETEK